MVADLYRKDRRQMVAQGVKFTLDDDILLNALAVKVRLTQNAARTTHLPRLAFLPKRGGGGGIGGLVEWLKGLLTSSTSSTSSTLVIREPTIAHEMWLEQATRYILMDNNRSFDLLHGYALSHPAEKLVSADDPKRLIRTVFTFGKRNLNHLTREQLSAAVDYVLFGANWKACESGPAKTVPEASRLAGDGSHPSATIGLLTEARSIRLPISLDDAKRMTASELDEAITRCLAKDHKIDFDAERHRAMGEYVRARNAIRKRSAEEVKGGKDGEDGE